MSESPKHFTNSERSKFSVRKLANELTESSKSLNKFETENIESNTELTVTEQCFGDSDIFPILTFLLLIVFPSLFLSL
jgi:hypothetical protein